MMLEVELPKIPTLEERELLMKPDVERLSAFSPRPQEKLIKKKPLRSTIKIECAHILRVKNKERTQGNPTVEWKLWKEAGKFDPPYPERPDPQYNANVWRNFRKQFGFKNNAEGRTTNENVANMYPLNIPRPSKIGDFTYGRFLEANSSMFQDDERRQKAIFRTNVDVEEAKRLKAKSEARCPPIDKRGYIIPPEHYKRYTHYFSPTPEVPTTEYLVQQEKRKDPFIESRGASIANRFPARRLIRSGSPKSLRQQVIDDIMHGSEAHYHVPITTPQEGSVRLGGSYNGDKNLQLNVSVPVLSPRNHKSSKASESDNQSVSYTEPKTSAKVLLTM